MPNEVDLRTVYNRIVGDQTLERWGFRFPSYMLHTEQQNANVFFGYRQNKNAIYYIGKPQDRDGHVLVVGGAGSGKSSCIAIPTLRSWKETFFAIDIKGELLQNSVSFLQSKYPVKVFAFSERHGENFYYSRYDPFSLLREGGSADLVQNAREIAQAIIPVPPNVQEPFWSQAAQNVLTAVILYVFCMEEIDEDGKVIKGTFNDAMALIQSKPIWELIEEIGNSGNKDAIMHINQFRGIECPEDSKMLAGIGAELSNRVMLFATDNRIKAAFSKDETMMKWEDLETHNIYI